MRPQCVKLVDGVTVLGNLAIDVINGAPKSPGGCASFAGVGPGSRGRTGRIVAMGAPNGPRSCSTRCSSGSARWSGSCPPIGPAGSGWTTPTSITAGCRSTRSGRCGVPPEIEAADPGHDVGAPGAAAAHGLPRRARWRCSPSAGTASPTTARAWSAPTGWGRSSWTAHYPPELLRHISVLKLAEDEAVIVADGAFDASTAERLGVPEILVTYGSEGCDIYTDDTVVRVPAAWRVEGVQTTGAGDMFTSCYVANRAAGADPREPWNWRANSSPANSRSGCKWVPDLV